MLIFDAAGRRADFSKPSDPLAVVLTQLRAKRVFSQLKASVKAPPKNPPAKPPRSPPSSSRPPRQTEPAKESGLPKETGLPKEPELAKEPEPVKEPMLNKERRKEDFKIPKAIPLKLGQDRAERPKVEKTEVQLPKLPESE